MDVSVAAGIILFGVIFTVANLLGVYSQKVNR